MGIKGAKFWDDRDRLHSQENNPTEAYLKATLKETKLGWLESCGPSASVNCLDALGYDIVIECPGVFIPQSEEVLMDYFNDPNNKTKLNAIRAMDESIPENRVPQYYPVAVQEVFNAKAAFQWGKNFDSIVTMLVEGRAVQLCLIKPGHYIAAVAYDEDTKEIIYHDSWGARFPDGKGGFARRMSKAEYDQNVKDYFIVYV